MGGSQLDFLLFPSKCGHRKPKKKHHAENAAPYSMSSLFREFVKEFSEGFLGLCGTIWGLFGTHVGSVLGGFREKKYSKNIKIPKPCFYYSKLPRRSLFIEWCVLKNAFDGKKQTNIKCPPRCRASSQVWWPHFLCCVLCIPSWRLHENPKRRRLC